MAWDRDSKGVCCTSLRYSPNRARHSYSIGNLGIACPGTDRDLSQGLPDTLLKGRAPDVERKIEAETRHFYEANDCRYKRLERAISAKEVRTGETVFQITDQGLRIFAQQNRTDASFALSYEDRPESRLSHRETDVFLVASSFESARCHAENLIGVAIEAAA